ncbi:DHA2 family efflux MFS transporter permease subunit [Isoptericola sp. NEAU-Y5]|uniref:DHA2 family efflux MFS transporter permease subunit n=1 Tax=Isoptericola luteus TaxID=2879484 RepID=A0ABS7ZK32_9MICO|nr:DHA2 family efflux MFS transporter permease subunit [Isoptericola sp. NEAU-Y5]MCA5894867.1 DHA2 family efflux MFS transporter permease subunit [Isoptericola sp. NEAU-Y5]MCA5895243.1 DHA2 family efflux MFS transporter permease subunit [Isoptericola sp. NEAU-Y5]
MTDTSGRAPVIPLVDLGGRSAWSVLPPLILGFFMIMVDTTIVNIAIPTLTEQFSASLIEVGWVNSAYLLSYAVLMLLAGRLGDRYGQKAVFIVGLVVFTVFSFLCGFSGNIGSAPEIGWLIAFRVLQGVGAALMTPQTMSMITRVFPARQRGAALGLWGATAGVATIAGPLLGGVFVETVGWEWIFYVNIPVGVAALWFSVTRLPHLPSHGTTLDPLGVVLSLVGLGAVVFGLQEGENYDWGQIWGPVTVWSLIGAGLLVMVAFVAWQYRMGADALLPLRLFRSRNFSLANVDGMVVTFAMIGIFFPLTIYLQSILGLTPIQAALVMMPGSLVSGVVAPIAGRLSDRVPAKWVVAAGFTGIAGSVVWLAAVLDPALSPWVLVWPMALFGVGTGLTFSPLSNLATSGLDARTAGAGAGAFNTNRQVGGVIGSAVVVAALSSRLSVTVPAAAQELATSLPQQYRQSFVDGITRASGDLGTTATGSVQLPDGVPADIAEQVGAAAQQAFVAGFADAAAQTLLLVGAVLVIGIVCAALMSATQHHEDVEPV